MDSPSGRLPVNFIGEHVVARDEPRVQFSPPPTTRSALVHGRIGGSRRNGSLPEWGDRHDAEIRGRDPGQKTASCRGA